MDSGGKSEGAFRTIGELSEELGIPQHILRYWETRFPQLRPLQRAGKRRYYRPADVALVTRIHGLLNKEGYTVKGVQKLLAGQALPSADLPSPSPSPPAPAIATDVLRAVPDVRGALLAIRERLNQALLSDIA